MYGIHMISLFIFKLKSDYFWVSMHDFSVLQHKIFEGIL